MDLRHVTRKTVFGGFATRLDSNRHAQLGTDRQTSSLFTSHFHTSQTFIKLCDSHDKMYETTQTEL